jgi:thiamine pyrophosphokinase
MIHDLKHYTGYQSILCLNGNLPGPSFFTRINLPVIAADGAANTLLNLGIKPSLIMGDLDTVNPSILEHHSYLHLPDQNSTDYQKSLDYLKKNNLLPAIVLGINGGCLDHILNNINIFMETDCLLYDPPIKGFIIRQTSIMNFNLAFNTKISLIGMPSALITSKGLRWNLDKSPLTFPGISSCLNRTQAPEIELEVHEGSLLVLIYEEVVHDAGSAGAHCH